MELTEKVAKDDAKKKEEIAAEKSDQSTNPVSLSSSSELSNSRKALKEKEQKEGRVDIQKKTKGRKRDPTDIRLMTELGDLDPTATPGVTYSWPNKKDQKHFEVFVIPQDGLYKGAKFKFDLKVPTGYPHLPPGVTCETRVYHPNIDLNGRVCLNILRQEWNPCLGISHVLMGLMTLFLEPNADDPLNIEAADLMVKNEKQFKENVYKSLRGGYVANHNFIALL